MDAKTLEFCYTNVKPIELIDLASAMKAVNDEFASFCSKIDSRTEAKLYVAEVRKGSVIIDLVPSVVALLPLADKAGITKQQVSAMERGKLPIGRKMAHRLADALGTTYRNLFW